MPSLPIVVKAAIAFSLGKNVVVACFCPFAPAIPFLAAKALKLVDRAGGFEKEVRMSSIFKPQNTLGDIVKKSPETSVVFHKHQLDFCCGGNMSLESACQKKGLETSDVLRELQEISGKGKEERSWDGEQNVDVIIDYILKEFHQPLKEDLNRLESLMTKAASVHSPNHPELKEMETAFFTLRNELSMHLTKEETILFPFMRRIYKARSEGTPPPHHPCGTVMNPIRQIEFEHDEAGELLTSLRKLSNDYVPPDDACGTYRALFDGLHRLEKDIHRHVHLENYVLHPLVIRMEGAQNVDNEGTAKD